MAGKMDVRSVVGMLVIALTAMILMASPLVAEEAEQQNDSAPQPQSSQAAGFLSKLEIHGFLTQAFATASFQNGGFPNPDGSPAGPTDDELTLGIPDDGTTDYRFLALQFRYQMSPADIIVIQFSSRALGDSSINDVEDEIELDWAFYERRIGDDTSLKVGRIPISFGIFNEVRDVGTLLPFYRPPFVFYREGSFTNETVDGINLSHTFLAASDWALDTDLYYGEWDSFDIFMGQAIPSRIEDSWGTQLWLSTPVTGLRFGVGFQHRNITEGLEGIFRPVGTKTTIDDLFASIDAVFEKFVFRAEYRTFETDPSDSFGVTDVVGTFDSYYAQFGYLPTEKLGFYIQQEQTDFDLSSPDFTSSQVFTPRRDLGFSFNYSISAALVVKLEHHLVDGEAATFLPVFIPPASFRLQPIYTDLDDGDYSILSLSVSF